MDRTYERQGWIAALALLTLAAGLHLGFSPLGFDPSGDGAVLAEGRRLLAGQIPHRDFISFRPAGSAFLHLPEVILGGDHALLISRASVWLEFALIAWLWTLMALSPSRAGCCSLPMPAGADPEPNRGMVVRRLVAAAAMPSLLLALTSNQVALITRPALDGFLAWSLACFCLFDDVPRSRVAGLIAAGLAGLFAPQFLALALAAPFLWGRWREPRSWLLALAPGALYFAAIGLFGGAGDLATQVFASPFAAWSREIPGAEAILDCLESTRFWQGAGLGLISVLLLRLSLRIIDERGANLARSIAGTLITVALAIAALSVGSKDFATRGGHLMFGMGVVMLAAPGNDRRGLGAALAGAWCTSIAAGRGAADLTTGAIAAMLARYGGSMLPPLPRAATGGAIMIVVLAIVSLAQIGAGRLQNLDGSGPAAVRHDLAGVLPGASGIRTNADTGALLEDLRAWSAKLDRHSLAIVPDIPAWWITAPSLSPMPLGEWPVTEPVVPALVARVSAAFEKQRGRITILVRKQVPESEESLPAFPAPGWRRIGESEYFVVYE